MALIESGRTTWLVVGEFPVEEDEFVDLGLDPLLDFKTTSWDEHSKARLKAVPPCSNIVRALSRKGLKEHQQKGRLMVQKELLRVRS
jgi:hypothetical protein